MYLSGAQNEAQAAQKAVMMQQHLDDNGKQHVLLKPAAVCICFGAAPFFAKTTSESDRFCRGRQ